MFTVSWPQAMGNLTESDPPMTSTRMHIRSFIPQLSLCVAGDVAIRLQWLSWPHEVSHARRGDAEPGCEAMAASWPT